MKLNQRKEFSFEVEVEVFRVGVYFNPNGINVMVEMEDQADENQSEWFHLDWKELLGSAMASSQDDGDVEAICAGLRGLADKLEAWDSSNS